MRKAKKKKGRKIGQREKEKKRRRRGRKGEKRKGRFSWRSDGRISMVRELKLIHATRATHRYQNLGVSSNSKR